MGIKVREARGIRTERRANSAKAQSTTPPVAGVLNNFSAVVAPAATDDAAHGYSEGSVWIDTALDDGYLCVDGTTGAAVWKKVTP